MIRINMKDFYPWYTQDEFVDVPEEVATELYSDSRYDKAHERRLRRNKAQYSLDANDGSIEKEAISSDADSPETVLEMTWQHCALCRALNSLPETQGHRVEAHYIVGKSKTDIAREEGVTEKNVRQSIERGLKHMRQFMKENL